MAYLFITHDLSTVRQIADRVLVMHRGRVVEAGTVDAVLDAPCEDYTKALISAIPVPDPAGGAARKRPQHEPTRPGVSSTRSTRRTSPATARA